MDLRLIPGAVPSDAERLARLSEAVPPHKTVEQFIAKWRRTSSSFEISSSSTISTAARSAAAAVRFADRVWSRKSWPSSTVNSMSCMSR